MKAPSSDGPLNLELAFSCGSDFIVKSNMLCSVSCKVRDWLKGEEL